MSPESVKTSPFLPNLDVQLLGRPAERDAAARAADPDQEITDPGLVEVLAELRRQPEHELGRARVGELDKLVDAVDPRGDVLAAPRPPENFFLSLRDTSEQQAYGRWSGYIDR